MEVLVPLIFLSSAEVQNYTDSPSSAETLDLLGPNWSNAPGSRTSSQREPLPSMTENVGGLNSLERAWEEFGEAIKKDYRNNVFSSEFIRERLTTAAEEIFTEVDKTIIHYEEELDRQRRLLETYWKPQIKLQRTATMPSVESLREFIRERLTAAADEIFTEVDKTIVYYEEELDRQRRMLEICWKPQIKLQRIDHPEHYVWRERNSNLNLKEPEPQQKKENQGEFKPQQIKEEQEETEAEQMKVNQEEPGQLGSEPLQGKDEQEELCISLGKGRLDLKQETGKYAVNPTYEERDLEIPPNRDSILIQISSEPENQNQENSHHEEPGSMGKFMLSSSKMEDKQKPADSHKHKEDVLLLSHETPTPPPTPPLPSLRTSVDLLRTVWAVDAIPSYHQGQWPL
ncbi:hypothetical protein CRENBAI_003059 [Crenichthys baileyi]|uniref:Uncharacterized protein n=1 Tax=Crenichthys baileyi TaxID=28760 RepID=A0AAV9S5V0_9TELE